jgi:hypothetical protein
MWCATEWSSLVISQRFAPFLSPLLRFFPNTLLAAAATARCRRAHLNHSPLHSPRCRARLARLAAQDQPDRAPTGGDPVGERGDRGEEEQEQPDRAKEEILVASPRSPPAARRTRRRRPAAARCPHLVDDHRTSIPW